MEIYNSFQCEYSVVIVVTCILIEKEQDKPSFVKIFILYFHRDIFLEKHWRSVLGRSVCDHFFEAQGKVIKLTSCVVVNFLSRDFC